MRKLLIVSPRFPPKNAPDVHRVRASLRYYPQFGWKPTVLCLTPESSDGVDDFLLQEGLPKDVRTIRVSAWSEKRCRRFGFGHADFRSLAPLYRAGTKLLENDPHDIVFFSTTMFPAFSMGPIWKRRFGCRLVYDFQDPWYHGEPSPYTKANAPGSWRKYQLSQFIARLLERPVMMSADHIISVSEAYVKNFSNRYRSLLPKQFTVLPFGSATRDFDLVKRKRIEHGIFEAQTTMTHWVYAGCISTAMVPVLEAFLEQLQALRVRAPQFTKKLRVHFVGTNYAPADRTYKVVVPLANRYGVGDLVEERSERLPYFQTLSLYLDADAILMIGSKFPDYTASKLFNCVAARKPVVALFHRRSLVTKLAARFPNVAVAGFDSDPSEPGMAQEIARAMKWLLHPEFDPASVDRELAPWSAEEMTRAQCEIFSRIVDWEQTIRPSQSVIAATGCT